jgi:hypothetical protein
MSGPGRVGWSADRSRGRVSRVRGIRRGSRSGVVKRRVVRVRVAVAGVLVAASLVVCAPASARSSSYLVTYAARACSSYTDIAANLARNDIQESLRDLGPDTSYVSGEAISPAKEQQAQPNCSPVSDWRFTLGTSYQTRAVDGSWGSLSKVTGAFSTSIVTKASTPLLDSNGNPTGSQLAGAVTVALSDEQARLAAQNQGLWSQGGRG